MGRLKEKLKESVRATLPIIGLLLILSIIAVPLDNGTAMLFLGGSALLVGGLALFQLGVDTSMIPLGEGVSVQLSKVKNLLLVMVLCFGVGFLITIAEPDLQVLADQVPSIPDNILVYTVAAGVGVFLAIAFARILLGVSLSRLLVAFYVITFVVAIAFVPREFLSVAFDSGGVTTGPVTVPFIMAMGVGIAGIRSDKSAADDSFGLIALSSVGPILAVMMLGIFYDTGDTTYVMATIPEVADTQGVFAQFAHALPEYAWETAIALGPIIAMMILLQLVSRRYSKRQLLRMSFGFLYTYLGLVLFFTGVNTGFLPVGQIFGSELAQFGSPWLLVPVGMLIGYFIVSAEPAVQVLNEQIEQVTEGAIPRTIMNRCLGIGMAVSVGLAMVRVVTGLPILWILIPGYVFAVALTFIVPKIFVGIAFDSGGVCSGPMTSTFLLPLAMGASEGLGGNVMTDAFGSVAMVAMTPLIAVQLMGLVYVVREKKAARAELMSEDSDEVDEVIEYEEDLSYE